MSPDRRTVLATGAAAILAGAAPAAARPSVRPPNIVVILADDLGWGDLGCYGSKLIRTPHIDRLARRGVRFTQFYAPANLCSPSRAGILTGRYPIRAGLANEVIQPGSDYGLPHSELTIAELLKQAGYVTALVGKWHLGDSGGRYLPETHGFDHVYMVTHGTSGMNLDAVPAVRQGTAGTDVTSLEIAELTGAFNREAIRFVEANQSQPFFLYLAHTAPHLPLDPAPAFRGRSWAHAYGDVVEEMDAGVGDLMATLRALDLERDTLVIFTSDNGPWWEGDVGGLHGRKGEAGFDGGYRVPFIASFPGRIPGRRVTDSIACGVDILPTALAYAGVPIPTDREIDGKDLRAVLERNAQTPHDQLVLFYNSEVAAVRTQRWKLVRRFNYRQYAFAFSRPHHPPLFDMENDQFERYNASQTYPDVWEDMKKRAEAAVAQFAPFQGLQLGPMAPPLDDLPNEQG